MHFQRFAVRATVSGFLVGALFGQPAIHAAAAQGVSLQFAAQGRAQVSAQRAPESCNDVLTDLKLAAVGALSRLDTSEARPILKKVMAKRDNCSVVIRRSAVDVIGQSHLPSLIVLAGDVMANDPDEAVRAQMARYAVQHLQKSSLSTEQLVRLYDQMRDQSVRSVLLGVYIQRNDDPSIQKMIAVARDKNDPLRKMAIDHISQSNNPKMARALLKVLDEQE